MSWPSFLPKLDMHIGDLFAAYNEEYYCNDDV